MARLFKDYVAFHRTRGNLICHYIGIPAITVSLLGLLAMIRVPGAAYSELARLDGGILLWAGVTLWYVTLDWRLGGPFGVFALGLYFLGRSMPVPTLWGLFVGGWIAQLIGHAVFEKKSPAFMTNFRHLWVGPIWIFAQALGYVPGGY